MADSSHGRRTLAEKLQWLRELKTPRGEQPPSYEATARHISDVTGVSISGPYFWELATGRTTNPKLHHLQALARFFTVPIAYLSDDEADFTQLEAELDLLRMLKQRGVRKIKVNGAEQEPADLATVQKLLGRLRQHELAEDNDVRDRLRSLGAEQRDTIREVLDDATILKALGEESLRDLLRAAAELTNDQLTTVGSMLRVPQLLDAVRSAGVRDIAIEASALTESSQQAVRALIGHLHQVEDAPAKN
ncbi:hypothetical protein [Streptomyces sp. NPDC049881]|uniref:hypothetical protein n=1 Tax=Streptomyces sp. NPDC049881 TaxID=3155778 RepID=UPI003413DA11